MMNEPKEIGRIAWIDAAKALGIFAVYLGHFGEEAGLLYWFVFQFHVPLFFFLSGCTRRIRARKETPIRSIISSTRSLLIPFFASGLIFLLAFMLVNNATLIIPDQLLVLLKGAPRNQFIAGSLWFLTCLWVIEVVFTFFEKAHPLMLTALALLLHATAAWMLPVNPIRGPQLWYNVDSALAYSVFFILGYVLFPFVDRVMRGENTGNRIMKHGMGLASVAYAVWVFATQPGTYIKWAFENRGLHIEDFLFDPLLLILAAIYVASFLAHSDTVQRIGRNTLYLCANENVLRLLLPEFLRTFGLSLNIPNPFGAVAVTGVLFAFQLRLMIPFQRRYLGEQRGNKNIKKI